MKELFLEQIIMPVEPSQLPTILAEQTLKLHHSRPFAAKVLATVCSLAAAAEGFLFMAHLVAAITAHNTSQVLLAIAASIIAVILASGLIICASQLMRPNAVLPRYLRPTLKLTIAIVMAVICQLIITGGLMHPLFAGLAVACLFVVIVSLIWLTRLSRIPKSAR